MRLVNRFALCLTAGLCSLGLPPAARAQVQQTSGFEVNRYQPTPAGEGAFWVEHPWYSKTRRLAAGLTLNYAHSPLGSGVITADGTFVTGNPVISDLLTGHFDFAISFANRVNVNVSLPVTFLSSGTDEAIGGVLPPRAGLNDPRFGAMVRVFGEPDESPLSVNLGLQIWAPLQGLGGEGAYTRTDAGVRVLPKVVLAGYGHSVRWSLSGGFLYRGEATLSPEGDIGNTAGSEIQFGVSVQYADKEKGIAVGPEAVLATLVAPNHAFEVNYTSLELLMGAHPDAERKGCPAGDRDRDGTYDPDDNCPDLDAGLKPDPQRPGCPATDRDDDSVVEQPAAVKKSVGAPVKAKAPLAKPQPAAAAKPRPPTP